MSSREIRGIILGMMAVTAMHIVFVLIAVPVATHLFEPKDSYLRGINSLIYTLVSLGISQLLYAVPFGLWLKRTRRRAVLKGVIITSVITALLCGGCYLRLFLYL